MGEAGEKEKHIAFVRFKPAIRSFLAVRRCFGGPWCKAWNKLATVHYLSNDLEACSRMSVSAHGSVDQMRALPRSDTSG
eukprot:360861-Amphidinium_carterae.1